MPDTKITALTALTAADPANDVLPIVDVSDTTMAASGTTKKISINNVLGCSGTATLASATITGDLTVDTSTLKVDSANNRVGIGTASPTAGMALDVVSATSNNFVRFTDGVNATGYLGIRAASGAAYLHGNNNVVSLSCSTSNTTPTEQLRITNPGVFDFLDGVGGTRMTLNSTGLGIGTASPATKLDVNGGAGGAGGQNHATFSGNAGRGLVIGTRSDSVSNDRTATLNAPFTGGSIVLQTQGTDRLLVDSSGNVGIGIAPAARLHVEQSGPQARFSTASAADARHEYYRNGIREGLIYWDANLIGLYATQSSGELVLASANTIRVRINSAGDTISNVTATAPTLTTNRQMVFNLTSDTNLRISVRGSDGTTRTANITLA